MLDIEKELFDLLMQQNIACTDQQIRQMVEYISLLKEWSNKMNLTTILDEKEIAVKHFLDSALLLKTLGMLKSENNDSEAGLGYRWIDVGTGAGFPGMVVKIMRPQDSVTLLDSLQKRLTFLQAVSEKIGVQVELLHKRAEDAGREKDLRLQFDVVTARAVAPLHRLCEYCLPFVKMNGIFAAMKGPKAEEELKEAEKAIRVMGGKVQQMYHYQLPDGDERRLIVIQRVAPLSNLYPRAASKIKKEPLI